MFGMMKGKRVAVDADQMYDLKLIVDSSVRGKQNDVGALASSNKKTAAIMIWNYHDDDLTKAPKPVLIRIKGIPTNTMVMTEYRIDDTHSNAYTTWKKMGEPQNPTSAQVQELEKAGQLQVIRKMKDLWVDNGMGIFTISLPQQGVSLLKLEFIQFHKSAK
jgi:xylan 1,4-beta-xylosidase